MSQIVSCPSCNREYAVRPELAGKRAKCKCGGRIEFPSAAGVEADLLDEPAPSVRPTATPAPAAPAPQMATLPPPLPVSGVAGPSPALSLCRNCRGPMNAGAVICTRCGTNQQTYAEAIHWRAHHPELGCFIDGYTDEMHRLLQVSEAIVTRGGTTTCAKALHFKCPILFNAFGGIMPQEQLTWKFFRNGAGSDKIEDAADFARIIDGWMADPAIYERVRTRFLELRYEEDPTVLIDELVALANEVAKGNPRRRPFPPRPANEP